MKQEAECSGDGAVFYLNSSHWIFRNSPRVALQPYLDGVFNQSINQSIFQ